MEVGLRANHNMTRKKATETECLNEESPKPGLPCTDGGV